MAFDVYAGTFTRFFTRQWESVVQKQARLDGMEYRMIYAGGDSGPPDAALVVQGVTGWRRAMNDGLAPHGLGPIEWSEEDSQRYFTDRPGWEGYSGLLLWAAYAQTPEKSAPSALPKVWAEDRVYLKVLELEKPKYPAILKANVWLPGDFDFQFKFPYVVGDDDVMIASTGSLLEDLKELSRNEPSWGKPSLFSRLGGRDARDVPLEAAAREGMRVFIEIADHAVQEKLPVILSF